MGRATFSRVFSPIYTLVQILPRWQADPEGTFEFAYFCQDVKYRTIGGGKSLPMAWKPIEGSGLPECLSREVSEEEYG